MSLWQKFLSNSFLLSVTEVLNKGFPFLIILFIIRYVGVSANGQFAASLALAGLFALFTDLGLAILLIRDISRDHLKASHYLSTLLSFKFFLSLVVLFGGGIFVYFTKSLDQFFIYFFGLIYILLDNVNINIFQSTLRALGKVNLEARSKLVRGLALLAGGLLGVFIFHNILAVLIGYIASALIQMAVNWYFIWTNQIKIKLSIKIREWGRFAKQSRQFFINQILSVVYYSIGVTILSYLKGDLETGLYNSAYIFFGGFYALGSVLNMAVFPLFSQIFVQSFSEWKKLFNKVSIFTAVF